MMTMTVIATLSILLHLLLSHRRFLLLLISKSLGDASVPSWWRWVWLHIWSRQLGECILPCQPATSLHRLPTTSGGGHVLVCPKNLQRSSNKSFLLHQKKTLNGWIRSLHLWQQSSKCTHVVSVFYFFSSLITIPSYMHIHVLDIQASQTSVTTFRLKGNWRHQRC